MSCATVMVHGALDTIIPCVHARSLHARIPVDIPRRLSVLPSAGHSGVGLFYLAVHQAHDIMELDLHNPRHLNLRAFLDDPGLQGDTIAAAVPAYDIKSHTWSRPTLTPEEVPFIRVAPPGSLAPALAPIDLLELGLKDKQLSIAITDDVLQAECLLVDQDVEPCFDDQVPCALSLSAQGCTSRVSTK